MILRCLKFLSFWLIVWIMHYSSCYNKLPIPSTSWKSNDSPEVMKMRIVWIARVIGNVTAGMNTIMGTSVDGWLNIFDIVSIHWSTGYQGNGTFCADIDECSSETFDNQCGDDRRSECINQIGSYFLNFHLSPFYFSLDKSGFRKQFYANIKASCSNSKCLLFPETTTKQLTNIQNIISYHVHLFKTYVGTS